MGVAVRPPVRERIDDKTSFVSLHSRTFITALRSEAIDGKNERTLALPVGSFTRVAPKDCYFEWGVEERGTIMLRRCFWAPSSGFFAPLSQLVTARFHFFLAILGQ